MPFERLDAVDGQAGGSLARQDEIVADGRPDIDKASVGRETPDEIDENLFFFRFVDVAFAVTSALFLEELILIRRAPHYRM